MAIVNEVITKFSFVGSSAPLASFNKTLAFSIKGLTAMAGATAAAIAGVTAFTVKTAAAIDPMVQLSRTTGVSVSKIQELGYIASVSGSSLQAVEGTIQSLSQRIGEASIRGSEDFARLGISVRDANGQVKTADRVLGEVQSRFRSLGLSRAEQISFAEKLGIDRSMVQLLNRSSSEMATLTDRARKLGVVSKSDADALADLTDSYTTLKFGFQAIQNALAVGLSPAIKEAAEGFTNFLANNKDLINFGIKKTVEMFGALKDTMSRLMPVLAPIAAVLAVIAGIALIIGSPIALATAAIGGLLLIVDDLMVAFQGGDSLIRDFVIELTGIDITPGIREVWDFFKWMYENIKAIGDAITDAFAFGDTKKIGDIGSGILGSFGIAADFWKGALGFGGGGDTTINNNITQNIKADIATTEAGAAVSDTLQRQLGNAKDLMVRGGM